LLHRLPSDDAPQDFTHVGLVMAAIGSSNGQPPELPRLYSSGSLSIIDQGTLIKHSGDSMAEPR
jgi:hypothetical protein